MNFIFRFISFWSTTFVVLIDNGVGSSRSYGNKLSASHILVVESRVDFRFLLSLSVKLRRTFNYIFLFLVSSIHLTNIAVILSVIALLTATLKNIIVVCLNQYLRYFNRDFSCFPPIFPWLTLCYGTMLNSDISSSKYFQVW